MVESNPRLFQTVIIVGHAPLGDKITSIKHVDSCAVVLEVDEKTSEVIGASITVVPPQGERFLLDYLAGHSLQDGIDMIVDLIERRYFGPAKPVIIAALTDAYERFLSYQEGSKPE